jgi:cytochrome c-type protein NapB
MYYPITLKLKTEKNMIKQSIIAIATLGLLTISASAFDTAACTGCHGKDFEKKAMGKSNVVKDMSKEDITKALNGYKDGSYGGAMKGMMKAQATKMSDDDIAAFAASFSAGDAKTEEAPAKEVNVAACTGCHGKDLEKAAMGKSKKVNEMTKDDIVKALNGYKDGTYGGPMKGIMKGQATKLSEDDIKAIAEKFGK